MKILKTGKVEQRKFTCPKCECEFVVGEYEEAVYWDDDDCIAACPVCRENLLWCDGELYEEPTQNKENDFRRLTKLLNKCGYTGDVPAQTFAIELIANGVTFREE